MAPPSIIHLPLGPLLLLLVSVLSVQSHARMLIDLKAPISDWEPSTITWYGGEGAEGTMEGACGYKNTVTAGYGLMTAAASIAMWNDAAICGACFEVRCVDSPLCYNGTSVVVTVTNQCPQGSEGGWCDAPKHHLDMAYPAFKSIVQPHAGHVTTQMRRVACPAPSGVKVFLGGNEWFTEILVRGVGGVGTLSKVEVSADSGATWKEAPRAWGSVFQISQGLLGKGLSFRMTSGDGTQSVVLPDCAPPTWSLQTEYTCNGNLH